MSDLQIHANEVKTCNGCFARVAWLKNPYNNYRLVNVPESERGKPWLIVDHKDRRDCPHKERLPLLKTKTRKV